jgi:hypothetical protein
MARSLRSNRVQKNKAKLRSRVFGPVEDARTQRLSQKLEEIVSSTQPKPEQQHEKEPEIDMTGAEDRGEELREERDTAPSKDDDAVKGTSHCASPPKSLPQDLRLDEGIALRWSDEGFLAFVEGDVKEDSEALFTALGLAGDVFLFEEEDCTSQHSSSLSPQYDGRANGTLHSNGP